MKFEKRFRWTIPISAVLMIALVAWLPLGLIDRLAELEYVSPPLTDIATPAPDTALATEDVAVAPVVQRTNSGRTPPQAIVGGFLSHTVFSDDCVQLKAAAIRESGFLRPMDSDSVFHFESFSLELTHLAVIGHEIYMFFTQENYIDHQDYEEMCFWLDLTTMYQGMEIMRLREIGQTDTGERFLFGQAAFDRPLKSQAVSLLVNGNFAMETDRWWMVGFQLEIEANDETALVAEGLDVELEYYGVIIRYAAVTPLGILLRGDVVSNTNAFPFNAKIDIYDNGAITTIHTIMQGGSRYTTGRDSFKAMYIIDFYTEQPLDLSTVVSVEIAGEPIPLR